MNKSLKKQTKAAVKRKRTEMSNPVFYEMNPGCSFIQGKSLSPHLRKSLAVQ
ncbi:hypothetical protein OIU76_016312 [Salix suchowensis]|nr:hypothetical protein OIU76_016312 [Salix suchowensis]